MGIYDREYFRPSSAGSIGPIWRRSAVFNIVFICVLLYVLDWLFFSEDHRLTAALCLTDEVLTAPWLWWRFVTYGFVHSPQPAHIIFNMLQLVFLGPVIEARRGMREFWFLFVAMILCGGVLHALINWGTNYRLVGASGGVVGVVLLFVLYHPHARLMIFPLPIEVPAWLIGLVLVAMNTFGAAYELGLIPGEGHSRVAFVVHLVGLIFAFLYFRFGWRLSSVVDRFVMKRPRLSIRWPPAPHEHEPDEGGDVLDEEIDRILEKISQQGEGSLTRRERRVLMDAARRYRKRLHQRDSADRSP